MNLKAETKIILGLSLPIIANGFLESAYGFMNTLLAAHLGEAKLAANALVSTLFITLMVIFWGIISGVPVVISHYHGANKTNHIIGVMRDSLILSLLACIPIMLILWYAPILFQLTGQSAFVIEQSEKYLHALTWAVPFDLPGFALMQLFIGISRPRINLIFTLFYIPFLIFINYCLMFGKFGLPTLELAGIGWGTTFAYAVFLVAMWLFIFYHPFYKPFIAFKNAPANQTFFKEILKIGLPLGGMYSVEIGFFFVLAILMGKFGNDALAAHQLVTQYFWVLINVVYSIGQALSIRTGWRLGRKEPEWIMPITKIGQGIVIFYLVLLGLIYFLFPHALVAIDLGHYYDPHSQLTSMAVLFFAIAAIFQLTDGIRITFFSILKAMKDTQFTFVVSIIQFWLIAFPLGYYLAFEKLKTPQSLWIALIIGGIAGNVLLWRRLKEKIKKGA